MRNRIQAIFLVCSATLTTSVHPTNAAQATPPHIIFILSDDQGYGDVQCLNPQRGRIQTPSVGKLASQGMPGSSR